MNERKPAPFCHIFAADGANFVYDVNSNELLEVEPVLAAVLPLIGLVSTEETCARLAGAHPARDVRRALREITAAQQDQGLYLPARPQLVLPDPEQSAPGQCDTGIQHLVLSVTDRCNLRCGYCLHGAGLPGIRGHGHRTMSRDTALGALTYFLDRCDPDRKPAVSFYGGEPLLALDLVREVVAAARRHPRGKEALFAVDTNGTLLDDGARELAVRERIQIQVSLDGPRAIHDRHRRDGDGRGSFSAICANIEALLRLDAAAADRLRFVVTLAPPVDLFSVDAFFAEFPPFVRAGILRRPAVQVNQADLRSLQGSAGSGYPSSYRAQQIAARDRYIAAVTSGKRSELGPVVMGLFEPDLKRLHDRPRCPLGKTFTPGAVCRPGRRKLHVTVDGRYQPCERTGNLMALGSVTEGIRSDLVQGLREDFHRAVEAGCRQCWALRLCRVCFAHQTLRRSPAASLTASVCPGIRRAVEEDIRLLVRVLKAEKNRSDFLR